MNEQLLQYGIAGLSVFLMYRLTNGRMKEMTQAMNSLTETLHALRSFLSKND